MFKRNTFPSSDIQENNKFNFELSSLPPSLNTSKKPFIGRHGKRKGKMCFASSTGYNQWQEKSTWELKKWIQSHKLALLKGKVFQIYIHFHIPINKIWKMGDCDNRIKPVIDLLAKVLGFDDRYIISIFAEKLIGPERVTGNLTWTERENYCVRSVSEDLTI